MTLSRRSFFTGLATLIAAPAIVRAESLMKLAPMEIIRTPAISMRMIGEYAVGDDNLISRLDVLYGSMYVRPEWTVKVISFDEYGRILAPTVKRQEQYITDAVIYGQSVTKYDPAGIRSIPLSELLIEARGDTNSHE